MVILFTSTFMTLKSLLKAADVVLADLSYSLLLATEWIPGRSLERKIYILDTQ